MTIAEFSIHPIGVGTSVSKYVRAAIKAISHVDGLEFKITPMGTLLEARELATILEAVETSHNALRSMGAKRISSILRIDERLDKRRTMRDKVRSVETTRRPVRKRD